MNQPVSHPVYSRPESKSRKFWRVVWGSTLGFLISSIVLTILSIFFTIAIIAGLSTQSTPVVKPNSILKITLDTQIAERGEKNPFENTGFDSFSNYPVGLDEILNCIKSAATDPAIKGISLNISAVVASPATLKEIYDALEKFKESGKFIYAYSEYYAQGAYYLASVADKIFINRLGMVDFKGLSLKSLFFKGLLEKLDMDLQIVRHGSFKSAVEPFMLDKMSPENRLQVTTFANDIWGIIITQISKNREISLDSLQLIANNLLCENAESTYNLGLTDGICYFSDYENLLRSLVGIEKDKALQYTTINEYKKTLKTPTYSKGDQVAVIYAIGNIITGKGDDKVIASETFCKELKKVYQDDDVKAIVLRINSGGGSALASEVIWNEIELAKKAGKIVIASMGDVAASGGYYIACNSDKIIAQPNTITGSIGVFGLIPSFDRMLKNKLGITSDVVKTNTHADYMGGRKLDEFELKKIQITVEEVYEIFTQRVAEGRKMTVEEVDKIGQGRVWSGISALNIGLVDQLGNIDDAIALAASLANLTDYNIAYYPKQKDWLTKLLDNKTETKIDKAMRSELGDLYYTYKGFKEIQNLNGIQAKLPFEFIIE